MQPSQQQLLKPIHNLTDNSAMAIIYLGAVQSTHWVAGTSPLARTWTSCTMWWQTYFIPACMSRTMTRACSKLLSKSCSCQLASVIRHPYSLSYDSLASHVEKTFCSLGIVVGCPGSCSVSELVSASVVVVAFLLEGWLVSLWNLHLVRLRMLPNHIPLASALVAVVVALVLRMSGQMFDACRVLVPRSNADKM